MTQPLWQYVQWIKWRNEAVFSFGLNHCTHLGRKEGKDFRLLDYSAWIKKRHRDTEHFFHHCPTALLLYTLLYFYKLYCQLQDRAPECTISLCLCDARQSFIVAVKWSNLGTARVWGTTVLWEGTQSWGCNEFNWWVGSALAVSSALTHQQHRELMTTVMHVDLQHSVKSLFIFFSTEVAISIAMKVFC